MITFRAQTFQADVQKLTSKRCDYSTPQIDAINKKMFPLNDLDAH